MAEENIAELFAQIRAFGWNESKRQSNLRHHKIDFEDVRSIFDGYTFIRRSDRHGEVRYQIFGCRRPGNCGRLHGPRRHVLDHLGAAGAQG